MHVMCVCYVCIRVAYACIYGMCVRMVCMLCMYGVCMVSMHVCCIYIYMYVMYVCYACMLCMYVMPLSVNHEQQGFQRLSLPPSYSARK